ncbi:hypothetical protein LCGC14_0522790 [marine sediment metagenome]|uniref:Uncharacterized protein n=1 Tax=marine sediment metagenome TaxID=412755 RepID=A0A0F9SGD7_9ZZZZ
MPGKLKFPVMAYRGPCVPDCMGLLSAFRRGEQMADVAERAGKPSAARKYRAAANKAKRLAKTARCSWK